MKIDATVLRRLTALNLPGDSLAGVLLILADVQSADDARLENQRARASRSRDKKRERHVTVTLPTRDSHSDAPSLTLPKEASKNPEPNGSGDAGPTQADLERELFRRGRQVCGKASGGLIASLLKAKQHDVSLARSVLELAATKHDPREYVAAATRSGSNGNLGTGTEIRGSDAGNRARELAQLAREREAEAGFGRPPDAVRGA